ncbi:MAG: alpha/beta hydrolase [Bacilli bacterium]|nr:alpha/beta hydrolase [Bacilli bacterium]MBN2876165.1 alpha/beta hydrolase [Bacilli bacterium]
MENDNLNLTEKYIHTDANENLRICIYESKNPKPKAIGLLWMHGGGYAIGTPEQDSKFLEQLINAENVVVISPDYRLSIDAPYPAAFDDCYNSLLWMKEHAEELGIDSDKLFVGGSSAGGGLAVALSLKARDENSVKIAYLMPMYPMLNDRMDSESAIDNDAPVWNSKLNTAAWRLYLGDLYQTEDVPTYASPARETNYSNLPPIYTFVGDLEPFHDEVVTYINKLRLTGIEAELDVYQGCYHAFDTVDSKKPISVQAIQKYLESFQYAAKHYKQSQD